MSHGIENRIKKISIEKKDKWDPKKIQIDEKELENMGDDFEKDVFSYFYRNIGSHETVYKLKNCACDGLLQKENGDYVLLEIKHGIYNYAHGFAINQIIVGKKFAKRTFKIEINEGWIIFKSLEKDWKTKDKGEKYPLEYQDIINSYCDFMNIRLFQLEDNELKEFVTVNNQ